eukprot:5924359-Prymnesium_polylepis.1
MRDTGPGPGSRISTRDHIPHAHLASRLYVPNKVTRPVISATHARASGSVTPHLALRLLSVVVVDVGAVCRPC